MLSNSDNATVRRGGFGMLLRISLPLILSNSCHAVNMLCDRMMTARFSQAACAASFTGGLTNFTLGSIFVGITAYTGTFVAQYDGAGRNDRIAVAVWQSVWIAVLGGLLIATGIFWSGNLFDMLHHDAEITRQEIIYFNILSAGFVLPLLNCALSSFWSGRGNTGVVLAVSAVVMLFNIPLNYMLIFGQFGCPAMGVAGAAWGTLLSEGAGTVIYFVMFLSGAVRRKYGTSKICFDYELTVRMLSFGLPSGIQVFLDLFAFNTFSIIMGCYGANVQEAAGITFGINNVAFCPMLALGQAASIMVGQAVGARDIRGAWHTTMRALLLMMLYAAAMMLLFSLGQKLLLMPFVRSGDPEQAEALRITGIMLKLICIYLLFDAANLTYGQALRGAGDITFTMYLMLVAGLFLFAVPCVVLYLLKFPWWTLWIAMISEIAVLGITLCVRFHQGKWTRMRVIEE